MSDYRHVHLVMISERCLHKGVTLPPGGGTWVFFGWVCAARDSKLAPRSKKTFR